jgi:mannan endo-1,6-alpha-mannosidase
MSPEYWLPAQCRTIRALHRCVIFLAASSESRLTLPKAFADVPKPYYWWEVGGLFGAMLDYSHYTRDTQYDHIISTAILAQVGPNFDYMNPAYYGQEGNDDQAFWGFAVMAAAERNFVQPNESIPSWLDLGQNLWNSMVSRWDDSTCNGGLTWQIFPDNPNGVHYKNTIANGGLFQLSARLARATNNQTYVNWANKIYDWSTGVGFVDSNYNVFDGADKTNNCSEINQLSFSYTEGIYMYGAAVMANYTGDSKWADRAKGFLKAAEGFFSPFDNSTGIMYERACETVDMCDVDMQSFKGYLARFMFQSTLLLPDLTNDVNKLLTTSALAAAKACTGGPNGTTCGQKWYVGGFDGTIGMGEEMCALEVVQGLLASTAPPPLKAGEIKNLSATPIATTSQPTATSDPSPTATPSKNAVSRRGGMIDIRAAILSGLTTGLWWARS